MESLLAVFTNLKNRESIHLLKEDGFYSILFIRGDSTRPVETHFVGKSISSKGEACSLFRKAVVKQLEEI